MNELAGYLGGTEGQDEEPIGNLGPAPANVSTRVYDADLPKTLSQFDAERIIARITSKQIRREDSPSDFASPRLTRVRRRIRVWPILLAASLMAGAAIYLFRAPLVKEFPLLARILPVEGKEAGPGCQSPGLSGQEIVKARMLRIIRRSEMIALGVPRDELPPN